MKKIYYLIVLTTFLLITHSAYSSLSILLVNDNGYDTARVEVIKTAITDAGYDFTYFDAAAAGISPSLSEMNAHDLVIWYTGNDGGGLHFWNGNETDNQSVMAYIDGGGMLWLQGLDFLYDRYPSTPVTFNEGDFVYDYLGISEYFGQSHIDDGVYSDGVPQFDVVAGNPIFTFTPMQWVYETMWYADALLPTAQGQNVYQMGPAGYDLSAYFSCIYYEKGPGKVLTLSTETARIDTSINTAAIFHEALEYFEQFAGGTGGVLTTLLVNDNGYDTLRVEIIKTAIENSGYDYLYFDAAAEGASPSLEFMSDFDLVMWYTGNDGAGLYFWNGDETDNEAIKSYIDQGGMMWVQGLDFLYDRYSSTPVTFSEGDFVYDYFGISEYFGQSHVDDGVYSDGVPQFDVVADNGIFTLTPLNWTYETMWYADALLPTADGQNIYQMGPAGYDLSAYFSSIYLEKGDGKMLSIATETARIDTQENTDEYILQGLDYFSQWGTGSGSVPVTDIIVTGEGGATTITEDGGSLQMLAEVLPENATINSVFWTVSQGTGYATINSTGLLQSTASAFGNGTVWAIATAADGSGVKDSTEITISNQGTTPGYKVLLVNDNAREDRYVEVDTILMNIDDGLDFTYDLYNAAATGTYPGYPILSAYDLVIWYTGHDGVDLYLWDISDTNNYKFNAPLIQYLDAGGDMWLQGLDFIYDVVGSAPDAFTEGQFIYDIIGISNYAAQSHADDDETGLVQMDVVENNTVCDLTPVNWTFDMIWYADGYELAPDAEPIYQMGPSG
ncbi:MAG: Ig-like domain-containing protein, partial [Bacteroidota bacterium]